LLASSAAFTRYTKMPVLAKIKHERFAQFIAIDGLNATQAYEKVQCRKSRHSKSMAYRWSTLPHVRARIDELLDKKRAIASRGLERAIERVALSKEWVLEELRKNVEKASQAVPVLNREGQPTGVYRFDGAAVNRALELIGKELGMFTDNRDENSFRLDRQRFERMTEAERLADNRKLLEEARAKIRAYKATLLEQASDVPGPVIDVEPAD
jgi:hypothetical protein